MATPPGECGAPLRTRRSRSVLQGTRPPFRRNSNPPLLPAVDEAVASTDYPVQLPDRETHTVASDEPDLLARRPRSKSALVSPNTEAIEGGLNLEPLTLSKSTSGFDIASMLKSSGTVELSKSLPTLAPSVASSTESRLAVPGRGEKSLSPVRQIIARAASECTRRRSASDVVACLGREHSPTSADVPPCPLVPRTNVRMPRRTSLPSHYSDPNLLKGRPRRHSRVSSGTMSPNEVSRRLGERDGRRTPSNSPPGQQDGAKTNANIHSVDILLLPLNSSGHRRATSDTLLSPAAPCGTPPSITCAPQVAAPTPTPTNFQRPRATANMAVPRERTFDLSGGLRDTPGMRDPPQGPQAVDCQDRVVGNGPRRGTVCHKMWPNRGHSFKELVGMKTELYLRVPMDEGDRMEEEDFCDAVESMLSFPKDNLRHLKQCTDQDCDSNCTGLREPVLRKAVELFNKYAEMETKELADNKAGHRGRGKAFLSQKDFAMKAMVDSFLCEMLITSTCDDFGIKETE